MLQTPTTREGEVIEEKIIIDDNTDTSREFQDGLIPVVVRSERNFLEFPFFALSWRGLKDKKETIYIFVEERDGKKVELKWHVTADAIHGYPTPFDYKVARAVDVVVDEWYVRNGYQLVNPVPFSIYRLAKLIGLKRRDGGDAYRRIKEALERIKATTVKSSGSFYLADTEVWIDDIFSLYDRVSFKGMKMPEGIIAETNYIWLNEFYLRNINARYVRPLDYEFLRGLKNPMSRRVYEVLSPKFYGLDKRLSYYHVDYLDYCQTLPVNPQQYYSDVKKQFKSVHEELGSWEYISKVGYVLHKGSKTVKTLRFYLGKRARREQNGELLKRVTYLHVEEQLLLPLESERSKRRSVEQGETSLTGLARGLYERGVRPKTISVELAESYPEDYISEKIEMFDSGIIKDAGGLRRAIDEDWRPTEKQLKAKARAKSEAVREKAVELEREKGKLKKELSEKCEVIFEKIIAEHGNVVNEAMMEAVKATPIISGRYDESKSFVEQSPMMQGVTRPRLRKKFPEMFKAVDEEYEKQVGEIDKQIEELRS